MNLCQQRLLENNLYGFAEGCLRNYYANIRDLRNRIEFLEAVSNNSPSAFDDHVRIDSSPETWGLQRTVEMIDQDNEVIRLRKITQSITFFLTLLSDDDYEFIVRRYFKMRSWEETCEGMGIEPITARTRWRPRLLKTLLRIMLGRVV